MTNAEPSILEKLASQVKSGLETPLTFGSYLRHVGVPKDDKGHDHVDELINDILLKGKEYAAKVGNDPNKVTPTYTDLKTVLSADGAIEGGKLSEATVTQILGRYASQGLNTAGEDYNASILRAVPGTSKPQVAALARSQGVHDVAAEVQSPKTITPEDVSRVGGPGLQDFVQKAQAAYSRGRVHFDNFMKGFKESIAQYAHAPTYAPGH